MKKKLLLAAVSALSVFAFAACSSGSSDQIATMKGGTITVDDFYQEAKNTSDNQSLVRQLIVLDVFEKAYGDDVTEDQIDEEYNKVADQYDDFETQLESAGYTKKTYREQIKRQLALQAGLKANIELTDADMKAAWEAFHPEVEAQIIAVASEDDANDVIKEAKKEGADFGKIAKEKSTDTTTSKDGGKVTFDSLSTAIPTEVQTAAFALKNDEISEPITVTNTSTYATIYYVVKMVKNQDKGNDMSKFEDKVKETAENTKLNDATFTAQAIGAELKKANVKIKDDAFSNVLSDYITAAETKDSEDATDETADSKESSTDDSEAATSTTESSETATSTTDSK